MSSLVPQLTSEEELDRTRLEQQVKQGFYLTGTALRELRDRKLWRGTHGSFDEYCLDKFGFVRRQAERLIASVNVYDNLRPNGSQILPTNERQIRELASHEPEEQRRIWNDAVERSGGKTPSGRLVQQIANASQKEQKPKSELIEVAGKRAVVMDTSNPYYQKTVEIVDGFPIKGDDMMVFFRAGSSPEMPCRLSLMQIVGENDNEVLDTPTVPDPGRSASKPKIANLQDEILWLKQILREILECARDHIPEPLLSTALNLIEE